jgi:hypothetical protein
VELVRIGAGVPDLDVKIVGVARWRSTSDPDGFVAWRASSSVENPHSTVRVALEAWE